MTDGADGRTRAREELLAMAADAGGMIRVIFDVVLKRRGERVTATTVRPVGPVVFDVIVVVVEKTRVIDTATARALRSPSRAVARRRAPASLLLCGCFSACLNRNRARVNKHHARHQDEHGQHHDAASTLMTIRLNPLHGDCFPLAGALTILAARAYFGGAQVKVKAAAFAPLTSFAFVFGPRTTPTSTPGPALTSFFAFHRKQSLPSSIGTRFEM